MTDTPGSSRRLPAWWPLVLLTLLAAALRFSTLDLQSFWYDEAFTPVHVLHPGLGATLHAFVHDENTPPLWYLLIWAWSRLFGLGMVALRFPSAIAGVATVAVAWGIGRELAGRSANARRAAIATAAIVAVNPLFVWYSQEARAYALFVFLAALAMLCFLRAEREPTPRRLAAFALSGSLALLTHYFALFLLIPMTLLLLLRRRDRLRAILPAVGALLVVGLALLPLVVAQGGHGTQWIAAWSLSSRVAAIPQYYLTGYSGAPLGHGIELAVALVILAALAFGVSRRVSRIELEGTLEALAIAAGGVLIPLVLALLGADYLAPRNVVAAMIAVTAAVALVATAGRTARTAVALVALITVAFAALSVDVALSPRLQRADWRGVATELAAPLDGPGASAADLAKRRSQRVITTVELGSAPLEYYLPPLHNLSAGASVSVREIDETGYAPLRAGASAPPAPGFRLQARVDIHGLVVYRFVAAAAQRISEATLLRHVITRAHPEVLVFGRGGAGGGPP